ncbi:MAG: hypothetical protein COB85_06150 [Bacteroidetes bacterium]|nr:MAG: hypothetical protein COB85_06150 [Bacteroidota bacterium]
MISQSQIIKLIFGLKIKELRQKKKLAPAELAERCGLSNSYLNEIEKGKKYPKSDKIFALAEALSVKYDELVSLKLSKKLEPVSDFLNSHVFKEFPLEMFGIEPGKLIELISNAPLKMNAFISTVMEIARNYEMKQEHFYLAALRSYQEMHDNYFEELENAVDSFTEKFKIKAKAQLNRKHLYNILESQYGYTIDKEKLTKNKTLGHFRSVFVPESKTLMINDGLSESQKAFLLAREIAFNFLELNERPHTTPPYKAKSFEEVLANFKASYFAVALLLNRELVIEDLREFFKTPDWDSKEFLSLMSKYEASPEMFLHRLTNLLPRYFGIKNLFFLRFSHKSNTKVYQLTKELHLSKLHSPHGNELSEHYCRRWISLNIIEDLKKLQKKRKTSDPIVAVQKSSYLGTENEYLCISIAKPNSPERNSHISVTIGFLIDEHLKKKLHFLDDRNIVTRVVNETCERCPMEDCKERVAEPVVINNQDRMTVVEENLAKLSS